MSDEKHLYLIGYQTKTINVVVKTNPVTAEEVEDIAKDKIGMSAVQEEIVPYSITRLGTEEEWAEGMIHFCPRCGEHQAEPQYTGDFECFSCNASMQIEISVLGDDE